MAAQNLPDPTQLSGVDVQDSDGGKIGKVTDVYLDDQTSKPEWAAVKDRHVRWACVPGAAGQRQLRR